MALECAGTRVHRVNGELPEEKRHFSRGEYRIGAFPAEPSEAISVLSFAEHAWYDGGRKKFAVEGGDEALRQRFCKNITTGMTRK